MNSEFEKIVVAKKALPKLKLLRNTSALNILGAGGPATGQKCVSGPTCLPTQIGCRTGYTPPAN